MSGLVIEICSYLLECWECRGSDQVVFVRFGNRDLLISSGVLAYIGSDQVVFVRFGNRDLLISSGVLGV